MDAIKALTARRTWTGSDGWITQLPWFYGWTLVGVGFLTVAMSQGTRAIFGVLMVAIGDATGWSRGTISGALAVNALVMALSAIPWGIALDRYGPRRTYGSAAVIAGFGLVMLASVSTQWQFYVGLGIMMAIGLTPLRIAGVGVTLARWFVKYRGRSRSIMSAGIGFGVLVLAPVFQWLVGRTGWQDACLLLGILFIAAVFPLNALCMRYQPQDCGLCPDGASELPDVRRRAVTGEAPPLSAILRHRRIWMLLACSWCSGISFQLILVHGVAHLVDIGVSRSWVAALLGLSGAETVAAVLLLGYLTDHWHIEAAYTVGYMGLVGSIALLWIAHPGQDWLLLAYSSFFSLGFAASQGSSTLMMAEIGDERSLGVLTGVQTVFISLGVAMGPALGGWLHDQTGDYHLALAFAAATALAGIACAWWAAPRHGRLVTESR